MKRCGHCKEVKKKNLFHNNAGNKDGKHHVCKDCYKARNRDNSRSIENSRKRRISKAKTKVKSILNHPDKCCANAIIGYAVKAEILIKPVFCEECGDVAPLDGHHDSYKRKYWLVVRWLCRACHSEFHRTHVYNPDTKGFDKS